jgi:flavin reductase (DIM6/NTAB) family NADH-FMN oxidoreductase RutF
VKIDPAEISTSAAYSWVVATVVPRPIAWVSTLNEDGSANLAPFSFFTGAGSDPPMCLIVVSRRGGRADGEGIADPKDTWRNIARAGEYVIHTVPEALAAAMNVTATDFPYGVDEFAAAGLTKLPSERVAPPRIAEAPVAMECRLSAIHEVGRGRTAVILGEILLWHVRDELIVEGRLDMERLDAVGRMSGSAYTRTRDLFNLVRPRLPSAGKP